MRTRRCEDATGRRAGKSSRRLSTVPCVQHALDILSHSAVLRATDLHGSWDAYALSYRSSYSVFARQLIGSFQVFE